ncbi:hypothetical protein AMAG_19530 [Allomyces macrogynus ATCC 38327]|uniref:Uncharacterized protein n=1 Tax=Allomyces macrogynus (strain ATCC 38327) TaxID=578462 RepID=A0A0L0SW81_ALLM3|nr:hypothetical protein AMAG_19530 [Allomyces macrogynus ATCC 38327]|eukprot:KNE66833.1 hypothetical protein AMAG_19530 [Allomyces macrogynus ATCC 38327]
MQQISRANKRVPRAHADPKLLSMSINDMIKAHFAAPDPRTATDLFAGVPDRHPHLHVAHARPFFDQLTQLVNPDRSRWTNLYPHASTLALTRLRDLAFDRQPDTGARYSHFQHFIIMYILADAGSIALVDQYCTTYRVDPVLAHVPIALAAMDRADYETVRAHAYHVQAQHPAMAPFADTLIRALAVAGQRETARWLAPMIGYAMDLDLAIQVCLDLPRGPQELVDLAHDDEDLAAVIHAFGTPAPSPAHLAARRDALELASTARIAAAVRLLLDEMRLPASPAFAHAVFHVLVHHQLFVDAGVWAHVLARDPRYAAGRDVRTRIMEEVVRDRMWTDEASELEMKIAQADAAGPVPVAAEEVAMDHDMDRVHEQDVDMADADAEGGDHTTPRAASAAASTSTANTTPTPVVSTPGAAPSFGFAFGSSTPSTASTMRLPETASTVRTDAASAASAVENTPSRPARGGAARPRGPTPTAAAGSAWWLGGAPAAAVSTDESRSATPKTMSGLTPARMTPTPPLATRTPASRSAPRTPASRVSNTSTRRTPGSAGSASSRALFSASHALSTPIPNMPQTTQLMIRMNEHTSGTEAADSESHAIADEEEERAAEAQVEESEKTQRKMEELQRGIEAVMEEGRGVGERFGHAMSEASELGERVAEMQAHEEEDEHEEGHAEEENVEGHGEEDVPMDEAADAHDDVHEDVGVADAFSMPSPGPVPTLAPPPAPEQVQDDEDQDVDLQMIDMAPATPAPTTLTLPAAGPSPTAATAAAAAAPAPTSTPPAAVPAPPARSRTAPSTSGAASTPHRPRTVPSTAAATPVRPHTASSSITATPNRASIIATPNRASSTAPTPKLPTATSSASATPRLSTATSTPKLPTATPSGTVVARSRTVAETLRRERTFLGAVPGNLEAWLLLRSLRTVHLRVPAQAKTATQLATWLQSVATGAVPELEGTVTKVHHASVTYFDAVPDSDDPAAPAPSSVTRALFPTEQWSPVLSVELGSKAAARALPHLVSYGRSATSLGGVESLLEWRYQQDPKGVPDTLVRVSVGLEDFEDLKEDWTRALLAAKDVAEAVAAETDAE